MKHELSSRPQARSSNFRIGFGPPARGPPQDQQTDPKFESARCRCHRVAGAYSAGLDTDGWVRFQSLYLVFGSLLLLTLEQLRMGAAQSVPSRGSGWVNTLPIFDCRVLIGLLGSDNRKSKIGDRQSQGPSATARWY